MIDITLIVIPGPGARSLTLDSNATIADLVNQQNLHGRDIIVNGEGILPDAWSSTALTNSSEIFATGSVKGN